MSSRLCGPFPGKGETEAWLPPIWNGLSVRLSCVIPFEQVRLPKVKSEYRQ